MSLYVKKVKMATFYHFKVSKDKTNILPDVAVYSYIFK